MTIGILLLNQNNCYLIDNKIPPRPDFDKKFLVELCKGFNLMASENTYNSLPNSLLQNNFSDNYDIHLGINGINNVDLLFIVRSQDNSECNKKFRFNNFKNILKLSEFEIWKNKKYFKDEK
jgi:hypothetical protein